MARETKRRFIVQNDGWRNIRAKVRHVTIGFLPVQGAAQVQVRLDEGKATLTIRSAGAGLEHGEFVYPIPHQDAEDLIQGFCIDPLIVKVCHSLETEGALWEIDEYKGANEGLVVAEVALQSPETRFHHPPWLGEEVTNDARFSHENLVHLPYNRWSHEHVGESSPAPADD